MSFGLDKNPKLLISLMILDKKGEITFQRSVMMKLYSGTVVLTRGVKYASTRLSITKASAL